MKYFVILLVLMFLPIIISTSFAQQIPDCAFGSTMTPLSEKFAKDLAVKEFLKQYPNTTKSILDNDSDPKQLVLHAVNGAVKETLELHFHIDEKGCYIPSEYHYKYNDGEIDVIVINTVGNFTEIMNLIKSDNITIDSLYPDDCKIVNLEHDISAGKVYGICEKGNSVIALIDASSDAMFQVDIPIEMVYSLPSTNCIPTGDFLVMSDNEETRYEIIPTDIGNLVKVEFAEGFHKIHIMGTVILPDPSPAQYCGIVEGYLDKKYLAPLDQTDNGVAFEFIRCNESLVLIQKYDNSPSCIKPESIPKLIERGWTKDDSAFSKINTGCMTIEQSKQIASFFRTPTYLPEGYSHVCSRSGMPFESYIVYYNQEFPNNWQIPELVSDGAIFIHQIDERNFVGDKEFQTYGSSEQRIQETYDDVMKNNPSLNPQLITINGMLAYAVDSCPDCGIQTANFSDGMMIQKSTSSETKIKFIDDNGVSYMLETTLPLQELIKVAESLQ